MTLPRPISESDIPPQPADPMASWGAAGVRLGGESAPAGVVATIVPPIAHAPAPITADAAGAVADALREAGFVRAATAVARVGDDARVAEWEAIAVADAALADVVARHGVVGVPSVQVREDGAPRFVVCGDDARALVQRFRDEHEGTGVDAELRLFLDEALQPGDRYVDAAPGTGFATLTAATRPGVRVVVLADDARTASAIGAGARASGCEGAVTVRLLDDAGALALPAVDGCTILHAGRAGDVAPRLQAMRAQGGAARVDAVAWRCGTAHDADYDAEGLQVAAAVLGVLGFRHFALAATDAGVELVPAEAMASNTMIFSLGDAFLARAGA